MGDTAPRSPILAFSQCLSFAQFSRLQAPLERMAHRLGALIISRQSLTDCSGLDTCPSAPSGSEHYLMGESTETGWIDSALGADDSFLLVLSVGFSALLTGVPLQRRTESDSLSYQVELTFEPEAIATHLTTLIQRQPTHPLLQQASQHLPLQPNQAQLQAEITIALLTAMTAPPEDSPTPGLASLHQQVEQERLLNQVTAQIRQSLELPIILQTAVAQVRQCLQVDRLVVYQIGRETASPANEDLLPGCIAYEALASEAIPSVLHLIEPCNFIRSPHYTDRYRPGLTVAIADVTTAYGLVPCLVEFLRQAQVRSKLIAPIWVQQELWGFLIAHICDKPRQWTESEQRFLQQIAEHLAIAIRQAQLYAEVQQQKQTLEQRVIERTQDLQDVILAAQSANRTKSEFLAAISHELRTPLTCIIGMSTTLQRWSAEVLNERQRHFLQSIHDSGEQLLTLINDILELSQAEAGKLVLNVSEFSLSSLAQQTVNTFADQMALNHVEVDLDIRLDGSRDRFTADPRRIRQILFNLFDNAVKFTPPGGKVSLRVFNEQDIAIFQIKDSGIGIAEAHLPALFQTFRQLDAGHQRQYEGTGLGLALTKQLVELHGGWIEVESTVGIGSVFTVRIPRQRLATDGRVAAIQSMVEQPRGRIVLIDHQEETAGLVCDVLNAAGYQVVWMIEGSMAFEQIEVLRPFAVITTVQLPDVDGYHLIRSLRQNPTTKLLKIIALTPTPSNDWQAAGADDYLLQPVRPDHLVQKVVALTALG